MDGSLGCTSHDESKYRIFYDFYGDSISFVIDSTRKITYYAYDTISDDSPYNFNSSHYQHTTKNQQEILAAKHLNQAIPIPLRQNR
jgi:hypothetical protein